MVNQFCRNKVLWISGLFGILYCLQFLLLPVCFPRYYPVSLEAGWFFLISLMLFSMAGTLVGKANLKTWLIADGIYGILVCLYNGRGFYGIGLRGANLDGMRPIYSRELAGTVVLIILGILILFQALLCGLMWLFQKLKK